MTIVKKRILVFVMAVAFMNVFWIPIAFPQAPNPNVSRPTLSKPTERTTNQLPLLGEDRYDSIIKRNIVKDIVDVSQGQSSESIIRTLFQRREGARSPIVIANVLFGVAALIFLISIGARFIFADGNEESLKTAKLHFAYLVLGLAIISLAEFVAFTLIDPINESSQPMLTSGNTASALGEKAEQIIDYVQILITGVMLLLLSISGYSLIASGDEGEKRLEDEKNFLKTFFFGAALILLSESIALIASDRHPQNAIFKAQNEILGFVNYALSFVAVTCFVMLILASFYFVTSLGNDDQMQRAKKIILSCVLGIIVAISSYTIASFMIR